MRPYIPEKDTILYEVLHAFDYPATLIGAVRYGQGHINDTFCVVCQPQEGDESRFILQGLSAAAFPHPEELMENFIGITSYLRDKIIAAAKIKLNILFFIVLSFHLCARERIIVDPGGIN